MRLNVSLTLAFPDGEVRPRPCSGREGRDKIMKGFKQINRALSFIPLEAAPDGEKNAFYLAQAGEDLLHKNKPQF